MIFPIWRRTCGEFVSVGEYLYELPTNRRLFHFHFFNEICLKFPQKVKMWLLVGTDQFMFFNSLSNTCLSTVKFDTVSFELRICFPCQLERVKRLINK